MVITKWLLEICSVESQLCTLTSGLPVREQKNMSSIFLLSPHYWASATILWSTRQYFIACKFCDKCKTLSVSFSYSWWSWGWEKNIKKKSYKTVGTFTNCLSNEKVSEKVFSHGWLLSLVILYSNWKHATRWTICFSLQLQWFLSVRMLDATRWHMMYACLHFYFSWKFYFFIFVQIFSKSHFTLINIPEKNERTTFNIRNSIYVNIWSQMVFRELPGVLVNNQSTDIILHFWHIFN